MKEHLTITVKTEEKSTIRRYREKYTESITKKSRQLGTTDRIN